MEKRALRMANNDNVATLITDVDKGEKISIISSKGEIVEKIIANQTIRFGFKLSLKDIYEGEKILKYGSTIGTCYKKIKKGDIVHINNIKSDRISIPKNRIESMIQNMGI